MPWPSWLPTALPGRVSAALGQGTDARMHFERAIEVAANLNSSSDSSRVAFEYAQMLEELGMGARR